MNTNSLIWIVLAIIIVGGGIYLLSASPDTGEPIMESESKMSFFITSANPGRGGDLGGISGADAHCQALAASVGAGDRVWRAYLSTIATGTTPTVHARDRIGEGPWRNAAGAVIANNIMELHGDNNISKETALTEKGEIVMGRGDTPNMHDILTGSTMEGRASTTATTDTTCANWTSSTTGSAIVGHHDRIGIDESAPMKSWVSSHASRGCSVEDLKGTGGDGRFYCFAQ